MSEEPLNILTATMGRTYQELERMRQYANDTLRQHGINESILSRVELSMYETIMNIIEYSVPDDINERIIIDCIVSGGSIRVIIQNHGKKFDLTKIRLPDLEEHYREGKKRGLGIYFIMTLMDRVEYSYSNHTNKTTLIKQLDV
jgi:anti-sigma regulatory factor (Ser/Thr protein kinase)